MKKTLTIFIAIFGLLLLPSSVTAQKAISQLPSEQPVDGSVRCASESYNEKLLAQNPRMMGSQSFETEISQRLGDFQNNSNRGGGPLRIPVVVHVVHNGENVGSGTNISDAQVLSQIVVINEDFRKLPGTRGDGAGVDTNIEFYLAKEDPNCNPTTGIVRYRRSELPNGGADIDGDVKPKTIWDPSRYLNMWAIQLPGGLLGYAQFPGGPPESDGVVMGYQYFGSNDAPGVNLGGAFNLGRTTTHEIGHYLGLFHTFQGCTGPGDEVADTPPQAQPTNGCPSPGNGPDTCPGGDPDQFENYMDYTNDACMNLYTAGQSARMQAVVNNFRPTIFNNGVAETDLPQVANDASINIWCFEDNCGQVTPTVRVGNFGSSTMTSATITYNINGGADETFNWSGSLASGEVAFVDLPAYSGSGAADTLNVSISSSGTDNRTCNNSYSDTYTASAVSSYATTEVRLRLTTDTYSDETTWEFVNSSGTVLYSGGPYNGTTDDSTTFNETFIVNANECYTFTINDAYSDGICCGFGNGSYDLRTDDDTIIIDSDGQFGASEATAIAVQSLSTNEFFLDNGITIFPNPTTNQLSIKTSNSNELPDSFEIYSILGQSVAKRTISNSNDLDINTSSYSNGVYFIKINKGDASLTLRFVKR